MKGKLAIGILWLVPVYALAQAPLPSLVSLSTASAPVQPQVHPAVARIVAPGQGSISYGSGTLIYANDQAGVVITNWHVINEAKGQISVHFPDGFYSLGNVQSVDRDWDLAAIVIRKPPNVQPVPLANQAPQPGETLTIAGYGSGSYRAASGRCTQYVAPGKTFPFEMVEVAVSARQGDSGGPIFNSRGELAGVLFGEGHGRTSGSYCGRVKWFLSSIVPDMPAGPTTREQPLMREQPPLIVTAPLKVVPTRPGTQPIAESSVERPRYAAAPYQSERQIQTVVSNNDPAPGTTALIGNHRALDAASSEPQRLEWQDLAGKSTGDQIKTVLAIVGVLAMVLQVLRWVSREPAAA